MKKWTEYTVLLKPSPIGGIGVFAAHDIPKGTEVFPGCYEPRKMKIKDVPGEFIKYCIYVNDEECLCPQRFDRIEAGWFLNHSDNPNISKYSQDLIVATRDIKEGEEILCNYNDLNEPHHMKEPYYQPSK